ncbi:MAG: hypothetical protein JJT88_00465 [Gammaproteobacteria bacterium]|nr:hypothetical protein [Gammaproteobacteria bacterium]
MWRLLAGLMLAMSVPVMAIDAHEPGEKTMESTHYRLLLIPRDMPPPGRLEPGHDGRVIDLLSFKDRLDAIPDPVRRYLAHLTEDFSKSVRLRNVIARDHVVHYSDYWTAKNSILNIVEYRRSGSAGDLTPYLGPLSSIPTSTYGFARYHFHYKDEVLPFWGVAQRSKWSLRKRYWARAEVFMPFDDSAGLEIAVIGMELGTNYMDPVGTFVLLPRNFE